MLECWQYPITLGLWWYWEGTLNTSFSFLFDPIKDGNSFKLNTLLSLKELDSTLAYLVTRSIQAYILSRSTSAMGFFPLLSLELFALLKSSHRLFIQLPFVNSKILFQTISRWIFKGLWDLLYIFLDGFNLGKFVGISVMFTCFDVLFLLLWLLVFCGPFVFVSSLVGIRFPCH